MTLTLHKSWAHSESPNYIDAFTIQLVIMWLLRPVQTSTVACRQTSGYSGHSAHWVNNYHAMEPCTME